MQKKIVNENRKLYQFTSACLSQLSYYIESENEAIVVDPVIDIKPYLELLEESKTKLKYILNTHIHSDFMCGSFELALITGATLIYGPDTSFFINGRKISKYELLKKDYIKSENAFIKNLEIESEGLSFNETAIDFNNESKSNFQKIGKFRRTFC